MGYRELLKKYIRFVEAQAGDHFIDSIVYMAQPPFSDRELGELRALAADMGRTSSDAIECTGMPSFNYRLRLLSICYRLSPQQVAELGGVDAPTVRRWRTDPRSSRFVEVQAGDFARFEHALFEWLARGTVPVSSEMS